MWASLAGYIQLQQACVMLTRYGCVFSQCERAQYPHVSTYYLRAVIATCNLHLGTPIVFSAPPPLQVTPASPHLLHGLVDEETDLLFDAAPPLLALVPQASALHCAPAALGACQRAYLPACKCACFGNWVAKRISHHCQSNPPPRFPVDRRWAATRCLK